MPFHQFNLTPLMMAARWGHSSVVELLLSKGADPNLRDKVSHLILRLCCGEVCGLIHCRPGEMHTTTLASRDTLKSVKNSQTLNRQNSYCTVLTV